MAETRTSIAPSSGTGEPPAGEAENRTPLPDAASIRRILVITYGHIADVLPAGPALHALHDAYPQARITVLALSYVRELFAACPYVDEVLVQDFKYKKGTLRSRLEQLMTLAKFAPRLYRRFDMAIILHAGWRFPSRVAWLSRARVRAGYRDLSAPGTLTHPVAPYNRLESLRLQNRRVLEAVGITRLPSRLELWYTSQDDQAVQEMLAAHEVKPDDLLIGLHPGSHWTCQEWSPQDWARVADELVKRYQVRLVITGAADERDLAQQIIQSMKTKHARVVDATGQTTILQFGALVKHMRLFICVNSAASQVGLAVGVPTLTLVGYENPVWNGPICGEPMTMIRQCDDSMPAGGWCPYQIWHTKRECHRAECMGIGGLSLITPNMVLRQIERQLKASGEKANRTTTRGAQLQVAQQRPNLRKMEQRHASQ